MPFDFIKRIAYVATLIITSAIVAKSVPMWAVTAMATLGFYLVIHTGLKFLVEPRSTTSDADHVQWARKQDIEAEPVPVSPPDVKRILAELRARMAAKDALEGRDAG